MKMNRSGRSIRLSGKGLSTDSFQRWHARADAAPRKGEKYQDGAPAVLGRRSGNQILNTIKGKRFGGE